MESKNEIFLARLLGFGSAFTAVFLLINQVSDPVNVTKMVALTTIAFACAFVVAIKFGRRLVADSKLALQASISFFAFSVWCVLKSESPFVQNFYGVYGRNTGFLTYFSLTLIFVSALVLRTKKSFEVLIRGLFIAGIINVVYGLWTMSFGDFVSWSNPYNRILGTFGNPNFIGAFLGFFVSMLFAHLFGTGVSWKIRIVGVITILIALVEIKSSLAVQGVVVSAGGIALVIFFYLRSQTKNWFLPTVFSLVLGILGFIAVMGALQKGPLATLIYKTSVSLRGEYWHAAINMALAHPFTGVGMDSYGDWYRRMRRPSALILPGPETVSNAAHNVPLDILAYGGWPLFISYLLILALAAAAIVRKTARSKNFDSTFVVLAVGWTCYQVQSLISINQIGLAVWGWLFSGAVIAYDLADRNGFNLTQTSRNSLRKPNIFSAQLIASLAALLGLLISIPPLNSDANWRIAIQSQSVEKVQSALTSKYMTPSSSYLYGTAVSVFESNNLPNLAHNYALKAVKFNPSNFDSWRQLYLIKSSTEKEKNSAINRMIKLDPFNPEWKKLP